MHMKVCINDIIPNCILTGGDWDNASPTGEANRGLESYNGVVISRADDGAIGLGSQ